MLRRSDSLRARGPQFRHVVFADTLPVTARTLDLAAAEPIASPPYEERIACDDDAFIRWVLEANGLDPTHYRIEPLRRRIPACLRALRAGSTQTARVMVSTSAAHLRVALSAMILGVTAFFRDDVAFAALGEVASAWRRRAAHSTLRIWSVGCSDGAELYSVAIALTELGLLPAAQLLGTDCRTDAVAQARQGRYASAALKDASLAIRNRYFRAIDDEWQVVEPLRRAITWRVGNVLVLPEPGHWDLILCRNLSIYLRDVAAQELWHRLETTLGPGGVLMVGKAERPIGTKLSTFAPCLYRRDGLA